MTKPSQYLSFVRPGLVQAKCISYCLPDMKAGSSEATLAVRKECMKKSNSCSFGQITCSREKSYAGKVVRTVNLLCHRVVHERPVEVKFQCGVAVIR